MTDTARLVVVGVALALIVGLIAYARGAAHHHGTDVGEHAAVATTLTG